MKIQETFVRWLILLVCFWPSAVFIADVEGQESQADSPAQVSVPRIVWQQRFEGALEYRSYANFSEPDVGISPDRTRVNPVRMVVTSKAIYILDGQGYIARRVPLHRSTMPDDVTKEDEREFINEYATTAPNGAFYIIRTSVSSGYSKWTSHLRAYNADGSLRFELRKFRRDPSIYLEGKVYISPNGDYMVLFDNGLSRELSPFSSLYYFDTTTGTLLRYVSEDDFRQYDFSPFDFTFLGDGSRVLLTGLQTDRVLVFDAQGDLIQPPEGVWAKSTTASQEQHSVKQDIYRQLVDPRALLGERPKEVRGIKMLPDRNRGVYTSGNTLYLFELESRQEEVQR